MIHCNFCGASQQDAEILIVSTDGEAAICGKCIRICAESVIPEPNQPAVPAVANFPCGSLGEEITT